MASWYRPRHHLTRSEIDELFRRSEKYIRENDYRFGPLPYVWRDEPTQYWDKIERFMIPYLKDHNGDPRSSINGNLYGLFFGCALDKTSLQPPTTSYFGNERLMIASNLIYNDWKNVYFADFYCHYEVHYVTLVITSPGSCADSFCKRHYLKKLNSIDNPFIVVDESELFVTLGVNVELFYTDSVDISSILYHNLGNFSYVRTCGCGHSKPEGIPKNPDCPLCNLRGSMNFFQDWSMSTQKDILTRKSFDKQVKKIENF
ncbi:phytanoyl-CoA hydroxylase-interacting protein-like [Saccostrea echinata]|uniref:phytanoyl-CoA hydroxylase-interacting protein-like n=1 Tax=Saccostrea echinata TaxID=191078 RepID=UPI002A828CBE|nr:phytanoyl-CoA hydroxylase-interacting protein-like [Saccostrea echinata]